MYCRCVDIARVYIYEIFFTLRARCCCPPSIFTQLKYIFMRNYLAHIRLRGSVSVCMRYVRKQVYVHMFIRIFFVRSFVRYFSVSLSIDVCVCVRRYPRGIRIVEEANIYYTYQRRWRWWRQKKHTRNTKHPKCNSTAFNITCVHIHSKRNWTWKT